MAEDISARVAWALKKALTPKDAAAPSGRGTATFVRRDESGVGWVRIPGNDFDTPVAGGIVAEAQPGDTVTYNIENNGVTITGNSTSPSVGGRFVGEALAPVRKAVSGLGGRVAASLNIAEAAQAVASAVNQHFWADTSGIHVTEATQEAWQAAQTGANVLINSIGQLFRDGTNNLLAIVAGSDPGVAIYDGGGNAASNVIARILGSGAQIGRDSEMHVSVDSGSVDVVDGSTLLITMKESSNAGFVGQLLDISETTEPYCSGMTVSGDPYSSRLLLSADTTDNYSDIQIDNNNSRTEMVINGMDSIEFSDPYDVDGNYLRLGMPARYQNSGSYAITTAGIDTYTNGPRITIPAGSYMFVGAWTFNSASASGDRNMQVGFRSGASGTLWGERVRIRQSSGNFAVLNVSALRVFTSETTVYLAGSASMTSGAGDTWITAVRLN